MSALGPLERGLSAQEGGRGMILGIADNGDAPAKFTHQIAFGNALLRVVGALGLHVGMNLADDGAHVRLGKDHDRVNVRHGRKNFGTFFCGHGGPAFSLQRVDGIVGVDGDDETTAQFFCGMQVANVANVEHVEAAVGESYTFSGGAPLRNTSA